MSLKNIWVAAGEGDLDRVKELVENESFSPNAPDLYTYTPMHAAASYGQIQVLEYLTSKGGDVNVMDEDDETPLFTVENVDVARWLVEHGADLHHRNKERATAAEHLSEEFPSVSAYLHSLNPSMPILQAPPLQPSNYATDQAATTMTHTMLADAQVIIARAEAEGRDPEEELRAMVGRHVLDGVLTGASWVDNMEDDTTANNPSQNKRPRFDDADAGR